MLREKQVNLCVNDFLLLIFYFIYFILFQAHLEQQELEYKPLFLELYYFCQKL